MKFFLIFVAAVAAVEAIIENKRVWYVVLFAFSVLFYVVISAMEGAA